jgi:hypothetical protein
MPLPLASNRSSVTEFVVNRSESLTDNFSKTPEKGPQDFYSVPCSPGRYKPSYCFFRGQKGKNIVKEIRSKSLVSSPEASVNAKGNYEDCKSFRFCEKNMIKGNSARKMINFEPFYIEKNKKKRV